MDGTAAFRVVTRGAAPRLPGVRRRSLSRLRCNAKEVAATIGTLPAVAPARPRGATKRRATSNPQQEGVSLMAITRWSPTFRLTGPNHDIVGIQDEVNRLFDSFFGRYPLHADGGALFAPSVDIEEAGDEFIVRADLPGVSQKDVKVSLMGDTLTIRGDRKKETLHQDGNLHRSERVHGSFERSFTLGTPVRNDKVRATYRDGVLEIHVPKAEEARLKEIEVQVG
jgi:HSP20 family protein